MAKTTGTRKTKKTITATTGNAALPKGMVAVPKSFVAKFNKLGKAFIGLEKALSSV